MLASKNLTTAIKTSSTTMDQLTKSVYSYLNMEENPYNTDQENLDSTITAPWIKPASTIFEWWIRVVNTMATHLKNNSTSLLTDFQKKFLKHPLY